MTTTKTNMPAIGDAVRFVANGKLCASGRVVNITDEDITITVDDESPLPETQGEMLWGGSGTMSCVVAPQRGGVPPGMAVFTPQRRQSYRVPCAPGTCEACLPGNRRAPVVNMSLDGLAIRTDKPAKPGDRITIDIFGAEDRVKGPFVVRNVRPIRTGFIIGLEIEGTSSALREWFQQQVMTQQRDTLARSNQTTIEGPPKEETGVSDEAAVDDDGQPEETPADQPITSERRRAMRGRAKPERRSYKRSKFMIRGVTRLLEEQDERRLNIETVDISRGGVGLMSLMPVEVGRRVMVIMGRGDNAPWVLGRIVHCSADRNVRGYRIGVRFIQSTFQDWPAPEPSSLLKVSDDLERTKSGTSIPRPRRSTSSWGGASWG